MSRRDWFRLRPQRSEAQTSSETTAVVDRKPVMGQSQEALQPVAFPENHGGVNLTELPPMCEGLLSVEQVRQLFSDIESLASQILLMQRLPNAQRATTQALSTPEQIRAAETTLLSGAMPRVQIRYHWESVNWIDTLERREDGIRLVRIKHITPIAAGVHPRINKGNT
jgi:hypothetical protein